MLTGKSDHDSKEWCSKKSNSTKAPFCKIMQFLQLKWFSIIYFWKNNNVTVIIKYGWQPVCQSFNSDHLLPKEKEIDLFYAKFIFCLAQTRTTLRFCHHKNLSIIIKFSDYASFYRQVNHYDSKMLNSKMLSSSVCELSAEATNTRHISHNAKITHFVSIHSVSFILCSTWPSVRDFVMMI